MVDMSTPIAFDPALHPRGQVGNPGQFVGKADAAPTSNLAPQETESLFGNVSSEVVLYDKGGESAAWETGRYTVNIARILDGIDFDDLPVATDDYERADGLFRWARNYGYVPGHDGGFEVIIDDADLQAYREARERSGRTSALHQMPLTAPDQRRELFANALRTGLPEGGLNEIYSWDLDRAARWAWDTRQDLHLALTRDSVQPTYLCDEDRKVFDAIQHAAGRAYANNMQASDLAVFRAAAFSIYEHLASTRS